MCVSGSLSPWQLSSQLLWSANALSAWQREVFGAQRVQVGLWKHPGHCVDLRISSLHPAAKCTVILEGLVSTDQSCAWGQRLPSASAGAAASAAREKALALPFQANRGSCFLKQAPLSWGNSFIQLFESNRKSVVFNFAIKMSVWLFLQKLNASMETENLTFKKNKFSTRFKLFHYIYLLVIMCTYIVLPPYIHV